jgi:hypothetical protein
MREKILLVRQGEADLLILGGLPQPVAQKRGQKRHFGVCE